MRVGLILESGSEPSGFATWPLCRLTLIDGQLVAEVPKWIQSILGWPDGRLIIKRGSSWQEIPSGILFIRCEVECEHASNPQISLFIPRWQQRKLDAWREAMKIERSF